MSGAFLCDMAVFRYDFLMTVRVRIAPSPTGHMHVGTAQSALFNWLFARKHGGQFYLRIEDTDRERSKREYESGIIEGLQWLGLQWDNGEIYRQSERTAVYRKRLEQLLDSGDAYWREYTAEEKAIMEKEGRAARDRVIVLKDEGDPERALTFDDAIRGPVTVQAKHIGQLVIAKSLDEPLYHFAVVIDDIDMRITHVIRGEDHISNTPKQLLIYDALGEQPPVFAHLPLMLGADRSKLSKRNGAVSITEYQKDYLPEAFVNFLGSLSYTFDPELLDREQMIQQFDLSRVHKSGAVFDSKKLQWFNTQYIRRLSPGEFKEWVHRLDIPDAAIPFITERLERLTDVGQFSYFWEAQTYETELLIWKDASRQETLDVMQNVLEMQRAGSLTQAELDRLAAQKYGSQKGRVYWPLRVALSGQRNSVGPLDIAYVIGSEETARRIERAVYKLQES
jgi:nondiscriminating glutamyl-tRNA synthetase